MGFAVCSDPGVTEANSDAIVFLDIIGKKIEKSLQYYHLLLTQYIYMYDNICEMGTVAPLIWERYS